MRMMNQEIRRIQNLREDELYVAAKDLQVPVELVQYVHEHGKLPVVNFAAGGVATPADAAFDDAIRGRGCLCRFRYFQSQEILLNERVPLSKR